MAQNTPVIVGVLGLIVGRRLVLNSSRMMPLLAFRLLSIKAEESADKMFSIDERHSNSQPTPTHSANHQSRRYSGTSAHR